MIQIIKYYLQPNINVIKYETRNNCNDKSFLVKARVNTPGPWQLRAR